MPSDNQSLETNRRPAVALKAGGEHARAVHDPACLSGGGRSACRSATGHHKLIDYETRDAV